MTRFMEAIRLHEAEKLAQDYVITNLRNEVANIGDPVALRETIASQGASLRTLQDDAEHLWSRANPRDM